MKNKKYNSSKLPKTGVTLVEASAGTGKTFSIIILYLRLLINSGLKKKYISPILPTNILVVTFTDAAKNELQTRLHHAVIQLYKASIKKKTKIKYIKKILSDIKDFELVQNILKKIKNKIEKIIVSTIHGFFWSILNEYHLFYKKEIPKNIIDHIYPIQLQATKNFWRKNIYLFPQDIAAIFIKKWPNPQNLLKYLKNWINNPELNIYQKPIKIQKIEEKHHKFIKKIRNIKKQWIKEKDNILLFFQHAYINKRIYNQKNLKRWYAKIQLWINKKTHNYQAPKILKYFSFNKIRENRKKIFEINISFFHKIDSFYHKKSLLNQLYITFALNNILHFIKKEKKIKNGLDFNDITIFFLKQIKSTSSKMMKIMKKKYPVVIIDEFQDLDSMQYEIFYSIYKNLQNQSLILFGDPKQSIYSFRNANIFYYFKLKKKIKKFYFLKKNFRSSANIIYAINRLFQKTKPFFFKEIKFQLAEEYTDNKKMNFCINNINQAALKFHLFSKKKITIEKYYKWISKKCANTISLWLSSKRNNKINITLKNNVIRNILPNDIAVLVKNKYEANYIKQALSKLNISAEYTSHEQNIFNSIEAKEIMWILDAILYPLDNTKFQKILITQILQKNIYEIYEINKKKEQYYFLIKKIKKYLDLWNKYGIFDVIEEIIIDFDISCYITAKSKTHIKVKNIFYLRDILIEKSKEITNKFLLLFWLQKKILRSSENKNKIKKISKENFCLNKINIITIYKSKGLEYPLVWIPFCGNISQKKENTFYCRKKNKKILDLSNNQFNQRLAEEEKLSEALRLLYVAITRSILHCSIGVIPIIRKRRYMIKNNYYEDFHCNPLGYLLIQKEQEKNYKNLKKQLYLIQKKEIIEISEKKINFVKIEKEHQTVYSIPKIRKKRNILYPWRKISFSKLKINSQNFLKFQKKIFFTNSIYKIPKKNNIFQGKEYGFFLHNILKIINFSNIKKIRKNIKKFNELSLSQSSIKTISNWIKNIISALSKRFKISLNQLKKKEYIQEMRFTIPIKKYIDFKLINYYMKKFDQISLLCPDISHYNISGALTGSIDLIFKWKEKFYFIDYKSNWLGANKYSYTKKNIITEIMKYRYDIQYQLYTLAIHRYLKIHIKNYDYKKNFGGAFYIFLRAFDQKKNNRGIFFKKPSYSFIYKLDSLFYGIL